MSKDVGGAIFITTEAPGHCLHFQDTGFAPPWNGVAGGRSPARTGHQDCVHV